MALTGNGVEHCEMFPLLHEDKPEILLSYFKFGLTPLQNRKHMMPTIKCFGVKKFHMYSETDADGNKSDIRVISGKFKETDAIARPPQSWAAAPESKVNIYLITLQPVLNYLCLQQQQRLIASLTFIKAIP